MKDFIFSTDKKSIIGITDKQIQHITIPSDIVFRQSRITMNNKE